MAAGFVMLLTGFAPTLRLKNRQPGVLAGVLLVVVAVVGVSVPLARQYAQIVDSAAAVGSIHIAVKDVVGNGGPVVEDVDVIGDTVTVTVSDPANLDIGSIEKAVRSVMGSGVAVTVTGP